MMGVGKIHSCLVQSAELGKLNTGLLGVNKLSIDVISPDHTFPKYKLYRQAENLKKNQWYYSSTYERLKACSSRDKVDLEFC